VPGVGKVSSRILEHVEATFFIKSQPQDIAQVNVDRGELTPGRDLHDFRRAILDGERVKVSDEKVCSIEGDCSKHDVPRIFA
jgi:hypothetical protein